MRPGSITASKKFAECSPAGASAVLWSGPGLEQQHRRVRIVRQSGGERPHPQSRRPRR